ncbi:MAG TPA: cell surface protein SprA, partial [Adhaeribacter sp.]|nr:cell surface protein SprA [Adhaeribacter sp.]
LFLTATSIPGSSIASTDILFPRKREGIIIALIHAESANNGTSDGQMRAFIRIGTDYTQNYYEYSVPLKLTPQGTGVDARAIWPLENEIDVAFKEFIEVKALRNQARASRTRPFTSEVNGKSITIVGNPDFSAVQGVMIGVMNPKDNNLDQSVCIWVNELRVSDFDRSDDGWAATTRVNAKLADLADITATGRYTAAGFGSIQQKIAQRARENTMQFDVNGNIVADKFLPNKLGLKVPVSVQYSLLESEPRYDPLEGDMDLDKSLEKFETPEEKTEYRREVVNRTTTKSLSLLNVRKEKTDPNSKPRIYDIENISLSYAYSEKLHTDIVTDRDLTKVYTGGLAYTYNATPKNYAPFEQSARFKSPYLKPLKELNATFMPSRLAFRADLDRRYNELQLQRRLSTYDLPTPRGIQPTFMKSFYFNRIYDLKWDLTKALSFDYTATNRAIIDELDGADRPENNSVIWDNLKNMGRNTNFDQTAALNYRLPLDKFPLTDWISADTRYAATYSWTASSTALNAISDTATSQLQLGNTIQNNAEVSVNGRIDMVKLYNKVKFLNKINNAPPKSAQKTAPKTIPLRAKPGEKPEDAGKPAKDTTN